ncbi:MAG: TetR/AcrR family transcriptional regulator [Sphingomonadales bacterium]|nr:TetR/AcrR family transcriptional regulator [Sphingomonadales bacterium]
MAKTTQKRIGRPRASHRVSTQPVEEEILGVAARLVGRKGFAGTSTHEIAKAAGLRQPSIFHYFKNKQAIFRELLDRAIQPVLEFAADNHKREISGPAKLYRLVYFDTQFLCTSPYCGTAAAALADDIDANHPQFRKKRAKLIAKYAKYIETGMEDGVFLPGNLKATTNAVFGLGESTLWWAILVSPKKAARIAETNADLGLRGLLVEPSLLDEIKQEALPI